MNPDVQNKTKTTQTKIKKQKVNKKKWFKKHGQMRDKIIQREEPINQKENDVQNINLQQETVMTENYIPIQSVEVAQQCDDYMEDQSQQMTNKEQELYIPMNSQSVATEYHQQGLLISNFTHDIDYVTESLPIQTEFDDGEVIFYPQEPKIIDENEKEQQTEQTQKKKKKNHRVKKFFRRMVWKHH